MKKHEVKRKGFTLVELLIVIVVIGVLSAMMMLSSTEAVSSAKASNIISNLRNLKTAALAYYADHLDSADKDGFSLAGAKDEIFKYLGDTGDKTGYTFSGAKTTDWSVKYSGADFTTKVKEKLDGRKASVGIVVDNTGVTMHILSRDTVVK